MVPPTKTALQRKEDHDLRTTQAIQKAKEAVAAFHTVAAVVKAAAPALFEAARPTPAVVVEPARTVAGATKITERQGEWTFEVTDLALVPRAYLQINPVAVKAAIRVGIRDTADKPGIAGIRIYQEEGGIAVGKAR